MLVYGGLPTLENRQQWNPSWTVSVCLSVCLSFSFSLSLSFIVHLARMQCASKGNEIELWNNYDINSNESEPGSRKSIELMM